MFKVVSCSRAAVNGVSRYWKPSARAVLTRSRTHSVPHSCPHLGRTYSTGQHASNSQHTNNSPHPGPSRLASHLNEVFPPLDFPLELASRILTHTSHRDAAISNNTRLTFIGRRVLQSYLMLFLHSSPSLQSTHDYELITARALNTYVLGEHVAPKWQLGRVLKWSPVNIDPQISDVEGDFSRLPPTLTRSVGLYKVQGSAVEAIVGGIFHQFGGNVAHQVFHTRVLPHILLPGTPAGLHDAFHEHAMNICERMGGLDGALTVQNDAPRVADLSSTQGSHMDKSTAL